MNLKEFLAGRIHFSKMTNFCRDKSCWIVVIQFGILIIVIIRKRKVDGDNGNREK